MNISDAKPVSPSDVHEALLATPEDVDNNLGQDQLQACQVKMSCDLWSYKFLLVFQIFGWLGEVTLTKR